MKIYIDNSYSPINKEAAEILYETGIIVSKILREFGFDVMLSTPERDTVSASGHRAALHINQANDWGADLFVALNLTASRDKFATGASAVVYNPTQEIEAVAKEVLNNLSSQTHLQSREIAQRGDAIPLKKAKMPAGILDLGFVTNKKDFNLITGNKELIADLVARGIIEATKEMRKSFALADVQEPVANTKPAFYQLYPANKKDVCRLIVSVFTSALPQKPIADAHVTVYCGRDGKHILIYQGTIDFTGNTIPIELPLFNDRSMKDPEMFCICVRHPDYMPKNKWIYVRDERNIREIIALDERKIKI
jgi:hypothetical protein